ncbi:hypothetical protein OAG76_00735 [Rubripirellula sp.]|nr:hypothetical protein [Rubripirellula sp.]MDB4633905.1 hypothetical protein [Rubripirellula sp.]MDC0288432.1 hypothetical protein [Rubripirellula sp.]
MMQPRQSDNQHGPSLPALDGLVPSRPSHPLPRDSALGVTGPVVDDLVIGAMSRSARIANISRELSSHAWSAVTARPEDQSPFQSRDWWRVDGKHDFIDGTAVILDQAAPTVGLSDKDLGPQLRGLLSIQVDVCPALVSVDEPSDTKKLALRPGGSDCSQSSLRAHRSLKEYTDGALPRVVCGFHDQVNQDILTAFGIDASKSITAESPAETENQGKKDTDLECVSPATVSSLGRARENLSGAFSGHAKVLEVTELMRDSGRITRGFQFVDNFGGVAEHGDLSFHRVVSANARSTTNLASVGEAAVRGIVIDATRLFGMPRLVASVTDVSSATVFSSEDEQGFAESEACCSKRIENAGLTCHSLEECGLGFVICSSEFSELRNGSNVVVNVPELWHRHYAWTPCRESVRWFVGNLLLIDGDKSCKKASDASAAVTQQIAVSMPCERTGSQKLCGAWVARSFAQASVDIHRVVLRMHGSDSPLSGSKVIIALMESSCPSDSLSFSFITSAAVSTPRLWARVSEFQHVVGLFCTNSEAQEGNAVTFASAHGSASKFRFLFSSGIHDAFLAGVRMLASVDCADQRQDLPHRGWRNGGKKISVLSKLSSQTECSRWDATSSEADLVIFQNVDKARDLIQTPFVMFEQAGSDELRRRIQTGPEFVDGLENLRSSGSRCRITRDSRQDSLCSGAFNIATLDQRFLGSWSFSTHFARQSVKNTVGYDWIAGRLGWINVGIQEFGLCSASIDRQGFGVDAVADQETSERIVQSQMVMRPVESMVTMQAATSFFFRHRARSAWLTEQVSNVALPDEFEFGNHHHLISCGILAAVHAEVGGCDLSRASNADTFDVVAGWRDTSDVYGASQIDSIVMCVGCTHACTVAHVPQYLNRAAWCRNVTPQLVAATCRMDVAEPFFPPLVSFELPRLVMPETPFAGQVALGCDSMMIGEERDVRDFSLAGSVPRSGDRIRSFDARRTLEASKSNDAFGDQLSVDCPTKLLIRRMRAVGSLQSFTNPLRNYLRANWSLSEVFSSGGNRTNVTPEGSSRFLVMTDKRSLRYLRDRSGVQLVSQLAVGTVTLAGLSPFGGDPKDLLRDGWLTDQGAYRDMLLQRINARVTVAKSVRCESVSQLAELGDVSACCSVRFPSLIQRAAIGDQGNVNCRKRGQIVWMPGSQKSFAEFASVWCDLKRGKCTVASDKVPLASSPLLVQVADVSSPMAFNFPFSSDDAAARKVDHALVFSPAGLQQSLHLSETCRQQTCMMLWLDRAA